MDFRYLELTESQVEEAILLWCQAQYGPEEETDLVELSVRENLSPVDPW